MNDLIGHQFGMLTVIKRAEKGKSSSAMWLCKCDCGNEKIMRGSHLTYGGIKSCGCYRKTILNHTTHNLSRSRIYNIYYGMKKRCYLKSTSSYNRYGGRGIKVCEEWRSSFDTFCAWAISNGYSEKLQIDRKDNDGNYEPENCKWSTSREQANNRENNVSLSIDGITHNYSEWQRISGISSQTLKNRHDRGIVGKDMLKPTNT